MERMSGEKDLRLELKKRIDTMESADYKFPEHFTAKDYIITAAAVLLCLAAVIGGAFL